MAGITRIVSIGLRTGKASRIWSVIAACQEMLVRSVLSTRLPNLKDLCSPALMDQGRLVDHPFRMVLSLSSG
jgi:hypothetical protein